MKDVKEKFRNIDIWSFDGKGDINNILKFESIFNITLSNTYKELMRIFTINLFIQMKMDMKMCIHLLIHLKETGYVLIIEIAPQHQNQRSL